ncbi:DMT family transporter [Euzebya sp.]|uniref:DMT family transporter n=1 Tax=Euzebya sp. TaxID=1971409 RepID=UPI003517EFC1
MRLSTTTTRALLTGAMALWGLQFVANHELLEVLTAVDIVVVRFIAIVVVVGAALLAVPSLRPRMTRRDLTVLAVAGALAVPGSQLALAQGQNYLAPAMAGLVVATQPAVTAAMSAVLLRERLTRLKLLGTVLALAGAAVVVVFATGGGTALTVRNPWGAALVFAAQVSFAGYTVMTKAVQGRMPPLTLTFSGLLLGAIWLAPFVPQALADAGALEGLRWLWFIQLVVGGTLIPYIVWNLALTTLPANEVASYAYLVPLFGVAWSWAILREDLSLIGLAGGALIIVGVVLTQVRRRQPVAPEVPAASA